MEYITAAISALEVALFWGMMVIVLLMFLTLLSIVGIGFIAVYFLNKLSLLARNPQAVPLAPHIDYERTTTTLMGQEVDVWYGIAADGSFAGINRIYGMDDSRIEIVTLPEIEIDTLTEVAFRHWEANRDQP